MTDITPDELVTRTHDHLNQYISLADNKASILLTAQIAFLGLFANAMRQLVFESTVVWWSTLLSAGLAVVGIFLSGWVVYPRTPKPETGLIFWENIVKYDSSTKFWNEIEDLEEGEARKELVEQNYDLAAVAHNKYKYLRWSLRVTAGMIGLAVIAGITYLFF